MGRMIDADKLWKHITSIYDEGLSLDELRSEIDEMPTVDAESLITQHEDIGYERGYRDGYAEATDEAEPVKHGHWIKNGDRYCECSVCHHEGNISGQDNYCWFCGAKMDVADICVGKMDETCI